MKKLKEFVKELKECMNSRLISVYVFGAKANSGDSDMHKHVDTLLIIEDFKNEDWPLLYNILNRWKKLGNPCPIIMTNDEFLSNSNTFAMEYRDLQWNNQLIYGEDLIKSITVDYYDLKIQCEKELKRIIQVIREFYMEYGTSPKETELFADATIRSLIVIFRTILRVNDIVPSVYKHDVLDQLSKFMVYDKIFFKKMIENREKTYQYSINEINDFCNYLQIQLKNILKQFNEKD